MLKYFGLQKIKRGQPGNVDITTGHTIPLSDVDSVGEESKFSIIFFTIFTLLSGMVVIIIYSISQGCLTCKEGTSFLTIVGILSILALSSSIVGALVGFIFGLPKTPASVDQNSIGANNNLEEISDWLTKIIVGVSLVQLSQISSHIEAMGTTVSNGLNNVSGSFVFSIADTHILRYRRIFSRLPVEQDLPS